MSMWLWRDGLVGVLTVALAVAFLALIRVGPGHIGWGATWTAFGAYWSRASCSAA